MSRDRGAEDSAKIYVLVVNGKTFPGGPRTRQDAGRVAQSQGERGFEVVTKKLRPGKAPLVVGRWRNGERIT